MIECNIIRSEGIIVLEPRGTLTKEDFVSLSATVDSYLADDCRIRGLLIHSELFPGWGSFAAFTAHMRFDQHHEKKIDRVAVVTDSFIVGVADFLAMHFIAAEIKVFPYMDYNKAFNWVKASPNKFHSETLSSGHP